MMFSLKTSKQTYDLETGRTVQSITANIRHQARMYDAECNKELYFYQPSIIFVSLF